MDNYGAGGRCYPHLLPVLKVTNQGAEAELSLPWPGYAKLQRMLMEVFKARLDGALSNLV